MRVYKINDNYLDKINQESSWFIGIMAADGNIKKNNRSFSISQSGSSGQIIIEYIKKILSYNGKTYIQYPKKGLETFGIVCTSPKLIDKLSEFNIIPNKSLIYKFPETIDQVFFASFIRGYFEGDGCAGIYDNGKGSKYLQISFVGTFEFIKKCSEIIPIKGNIIEKSAKNCFEIRWYSKKALTVADWLYKDDNLFIGKKYEIIQNAKKIKNKKEKPHLKNKAFEMLKLGMKPEQIAKKIGVAFQTIYKWKSKQNKERK